MLDHALALAARGLAVFPLIEGGRIPAVSQWPERATTDPAAIRKLWTSHDPVLNVRRVRPFNVGVHCSGHLVVDVDTKGGRQGDASLAEIGMLWADSDDWADTLVVRTPSGGRHIYLSSPQPVGNSVGKLGDGLDIRSDRGYVVGPGSIVNGKQYQIEQDRPIRGARPWLVDLAGAAREVVNTTNVEVLLDTRPAIDRAVDYLAGRAPAVEGAGGDAHTLQTALAIGDLGVSEAMCLQLMADHWNERCMPPWGFEALARKVENAYRYRQTDIGSRDAQNDFQPLPSEPFFDGEGNEDLAAVAIAAGQKPVRVLPLEDYAAVRVDFSRVALIKGLLDESAMSVLYGESNVGKTFLAMSMAYAVAAGVPWGERTVSAGGVVYLAAEAGNSARKRVLALRARYGQRDLPFALIPEQVDLLRANGDDAAVIAAVRRFEARTGVKCKLLVIDTLSRVLAGGNENASEDMGAVVRQLDRIRIATGAHVMVVHHSGKDQARGARGHSLLRAATDTEIEVQDGLIKATKQRDMDHGQPQRFELVEVQIGTSPDGEAMTSAVASIGASLAEHEFAEDRLTPAEQTTLDALKLTLERIGRVFNGRLVCNGDEWFEDWARDREPGAKDPKAPWRVYRRALKDKLVVEEVGPNLWALAN